MPPALQLPFPVPPEVAQIDWSEVFRWEALFRDLMRVGVVLLVALIGYRLLKILTRRLRSEVMDEPDPQVKRMREQRYQTVASLLENLALVLIVLVAGLTILNTFIPIGPILAAVGIFGLAISFGAQSFVKDVINGTFMLVEGQFGIGDVIRVGDTAGLVEKMTLRTTVLRDIHGTVHIVPNGDISRVSNLTKTWSRTVLEIAVAYKEDVDRVIEVLLDVGRDLYHDPEWGAVLLEEPVVPGVESFGDSGVVIRLMAKTLPLKQWDVGRELRRRIKKRFDADGIQIPFPHRTFYWGEGQIPPALAADAGLTGSAEPRGSGARAGRKGGGGDGSGAGKRRGKKPGHES